MNKSFVCYQKTSTRKRETGSTGRLGAPQTVLIPRSACEIAEAEKGNPAMSSRKDTVEKELGVVLPEQYVDFLNKYGIYDDSSLEVYGVTENMLSHDGIPSVIGATRIYRKHEALPKRFLVIHHTGIEDEIVCLDTRDGKIYSFSRELGNRKLANSFNEWFRRDIIEFSKEIKRYSKEHGIQ
jgi:hypothetical protein